MGLNNVLVEDSVGNQLREVVADPGALNPLLDMVENDESYCCLRFVDPYGDTVFNVGQVEQLLVELQQLLRVSTTHQQQSVIKELMDLARYCLEEPHRFLRMQGD